MSSEKENFIINLEKIDDFRFKVKFDSPELSELFMDEPKPVGNASGPSASRILSAAIGHCLSASLLFCLTKARVDVNGMKTTVETSFRRNEKDRLRIGSLKVHLHPSITKKNIEKSKRCFELFEDFCVVTQSVRQGIPVIVDIKINGSNNLEDTE